MRLNASRSVWSSVPLATRRHCSALLRHGSAVGMGDSYQGRKKRNPAARDRTPGVSEPKFLASTSVVNGSWFNPQDQSARRFPADVLPLLRSVTRSKETFCPSSRPRIPARSTALMCTNTSLLPSLGWMKPNPFWLLNHFTVPCGITVLSH